MCHIEQETEERRRRQRPAWTATETVHDAYTHTHTCCFPVVGSGGSRLLSGNSWYAEELELWIARFHKRPSALLFNSGYDANLGLMSCLPQPGDAVVCDELVHNSVRVSWPPSVCKTYVVEYTQVDACLATKYQGGVDHQRSTAISRLKQAICFTRLATQPPV